jgi:hypothetical protein
MNVYAAPASRNGARQAEASESAAASHEIKYRQDAASYVTAMLAELRQIAGKAGFDKLVKSLDAAYYDAYGALDAKARDATPAPGTVVPPAGPEKNANSVEPNGPEPH